ncbi:MAG: hypothetical protein [Microviridae sp.]|nr:MAG: hypothetical protein [Microviridae sp.]
MGDKPIVETKVKPRITKADYRSKSRQAGFNDAGEFIPDSTPMAPPIGYKRQESMVEIVRRMVRDERLAADLDAAGMETFEDADDFDVGDEGEDLKSGFENDFDPPIKEVLEAGSAEVARKKAPKKPEKPADGVEPEKSP